MSSNEKRVLRANNETKRPAIRSNSKGNQLSGSKTNTHCDKSIECNLTDEMSAEEEELILKHVNMSADDLKLKNENKDLFWQKVAECVRDQLSETLEDNQQLHEIKISMEQDNRDLCKEHLKLKKLADEADDICKMFLNQNEDDDDDENENVDDSGIKD